MWPILLPWILEIIPRIPSLVTDVEEAFHGKPQAGAQKWSAVEQALSTSISEVTHQLAAIAPAGTNSEEIAAALSTYTKAINDATVELANKLKIFAHAGQPAATPATPNG
jgi:hypothetical protein